VDLDLDSFKTITLHLALEVECGIELEPDDNISTVGQLIDAMQAAKYCAPTQISTIRIVR
jgi:acyl carrier protein